MKTRTVAVLKREVPSYVKYLKQIGCTVLRTCPNHLNPGYLSITFKTGK